MMACEACCTECMTMMSLEYQQQMMNMNMARCMMMCRDCADMCRMASMMMCRGSEYVKQMCKCVLIFVKHVQLNVKRWVPTWIYASNVLMHAENVHKNVEI